MRNEAMGPWKCEVLDVILEALAGDTRLREMLVFKGGRVLALRLGRTRRQSLDLDTNIRAEVVARQPDRMALRAELEALIEQSRDKLRVAAPRLARVPALLSASSASASVPLPTRNEAMP
ncbi:MAG: nucleotidyl transferase AbiEii/AbiGii toxin family protein [Planctomycetes bacterium]|jgi:predicted nucleotidyltransferase component of viral defense system|nr:nucleotidyl transferase AbiEii/AbiGii toxin family protein [Planctomycetota bacterium]